MKGNVMNEQQSNDDIRNEFNKINKQNAILHQRAEHNTQINMQNMINATKQNEQQISATKREEIHEHNVKQKRHETNRT